MKKFMAYSAAHCAVFCVTFAGFALLAATAVSQTPDPPLTWKGDGNTWYVWDGESNSLDFSLTFNIDEDAYLTGNAAADNSQSPLVCLWYGELKDGVRPLLIGLKIENNEGPLLCVLNGKMVDHKYFYGESFIKRFEKDGKAEKALGIGLPYVSSQPTDPFPQTVQEALRTAFRSLGIFRVTGGFTQ